MTTSDGMPLNFVAKMKYFEQEIAEQKEPKPKEGRNLPYFLLYTSENGGGRSIIIVHCA